MLLFKDLKNNHPVYILNKQDLSLVQGTVTSVGFPRMPMGYKSGQPGMVVDITITAEGKTATYEIPENLSVTYANNLVLATDKSGLINDVKAVMSSAQQVIESYDQQKERYEKASALLPDLDSAYKDQKQANDRLDKMEKAVTEMKNMMSKLMDALGDK